MIVLDENLDEQRVREPLATRYRGKIVSLRELRPGTVIKDEAVPMLLCEQSSATFVTTNAKDFWRRVPAHHGYCIICLPLSSERQDEVPDLVLRLFRHKLFKTVRQRLGKVIRASRSEVLYYEVGRRPVLKTSWG